MARTRRRLTNLANRLFPELAVAGYCDRCLVRLELVGRQVRRVREDEEIWGINTWRCPNCQQITEQRFVLESYYDVLL